MEPQHCARCGRLAPDQESDEFLEWEALGGDDDEVVCPTCVTPEEETAMAEDTMATGAALKSWRKEVGISTNLNEDDYVAEKVRENRLRRMAERQGLRLEKSRRRDPRAVDFGTYHLVDVATNTLAAWGSSMGYGLSLDEIEKALTE